MNCNALNGIFDSERVVANITKSIFSMENEQQKLIGFSLHFCLLVF